MAKKQGVVFFNFKLADRIKKSRIVYPGLFIIAFIILFLILSWKYFPNQDFPEGVIANRDILAVRSFDVENKQATLEAQNEAMKSVKPVYAIDPFIINQIGNNIRTQFSLVSQLRDANGQNKHLEAKEIKSQMPIPISDESVHTLTNLNENLLGQVEVMTTDLVSHSLKIPIREDNPNDLKEARKIARKKAKEMDLPSQLKDAIADIASEALKPNATIDWDETARLRQSKKDQVLPVITTVQKGQVIIEKGKIITPRKIQLLESMGMHRSTFNLAAISGTAIFVLFTLLVIWIYILQFIPELANNPKQLLLLILVMAFTVLLSRLLVEVNAYWTPVAIASILITVLINPRIAIIVTAYLSIIIGMFTGEIQYVTVAFITGSVAVLSSYKIHKRMDLIATSVIIFLVNVMSILMFSLIKGESTRLVIENLFFGGISGFGAGILSVGLLPLLEYLFGITTTIKLLEISNQSEPLIKKLLLEAPGTYHHSVIVGNLAEAAAEAVGEDPLLCRVGAYYHDIGKLRRPYFFIENQLGAENPHDKLSPNLSALIILSHVKDGIELAKLHKLPEPIQEIISQHHGTSIIKYFYHRAKQSENEKPMEEDFRYPGPRPLTKSAAIVMLADSVEAAARTIQKPTPAKIETLVNQIVHGILQDGQLDDSPLSLRNINDIIQTFTRLLTGIYHHRIEYPEQIMEEITHPVPLPVKMAKFGKQAGQKAV